MLSFLALPQPVCGVLPVAAPEDVPPGLPFEPPLSFVAGAAVFAGGRASGLHEAKPPLARLGLTLMILVGLRQAF